MTIASGSTPFTPDDLLRLEGEGLYELVDGKLLEKHMGLLATKTVAKICQQLLDYADRSGAGIVATEQSFQCFPQHPDLIRRPDVAFIAQNRAASLPDDGHVRIAPDLAIEVISPNDRMYEFEEKLADYRSAGVKLVWEVNPHFRFIRVHHPDHSAERLEENETLAAESVVPGFSIVISDLLPPIGK